MNDMTITSAQYQTDDDGNNVGIWATIEGENTCVPMESGNRHYDEIMRQVNAGTLTIQDAS